MTSMLVRRIAALAGGAALLAAAGMPALAAKAPSTIDSLSFLSPSTGFVRVGPPYGEGPGQLFETTDGGAQWKSVGQPIQATMVAFGTNMVGEALVPLGVGACGAQFMAVTTHDGGLTWHGPAPVATSDGPDAAAVAAGRPLLLNGSCAGPYATLLTPGAAGAQWHTLVTFSLSKAEAKDYFSPQAVSLSFHGQTGFAAVAYLPVAKNVAPLVMGYRSTDGGLRWQTVRLGGNGLLGRVEAISFANAADGIAATDNKAGTDVSLYATSNGGRKWIKTATLSGEMAYHLTLVTPNVGYVATAPVGAGRSAGRLLKTTDGGRTWRPLALPR